MAIPPLYVRMQLTDFRWSVPGSGRSGQVYLWTVFFKIDGDSVYLGQNLQLQGQATVVPMPGDQGDLGSNDYGAFGATIPIPHEIATYVTVLRGIPVPALKTVIPGMIGCVAVVLLQLGTPAKAISAGHDALNTAIQQQLNALIPTFGFANPPTPQTITADIATMQSNVQSAVTNAFVNSLNLWEKLFAAFSAQDEQLMTASFTRFQNSLINAPAQGTPLQQTTSFTVPGDPRGEAGRPIGKGFNQLNGRIVADPYPLSLRRVLIGLGHPPPVDLRSLFSGSLQTWLFTP